MSISFQGFQESRKHFTGIPEQFFSELLPVIDDLDELKVVLYVLWSAYTNGDFGTLFSYDDLVNDELFSKGFSEHEESQSACIKNALMKAIEQNIFIHAGKTESDAILFFINSPRGRQAARLHLQGKDTNLRNETSLDIIQPNLFRLYEENIGPLTPLIADTLRAAQEEYPEDWITEAIQIAVRNNVRRWNYISSILKRWQEEGRNGTHRRDTEEDYRRYLKGEYGDFGQY